MPTLEWIGKQAVVDHHRQVPYHLLRCDKTRSAGDPQAGNLLVQGDNLLALKALLPYYAGKVKCIYIDPPYNTGNENWVYNDNVNSPEICEWLGKTVGKEAEDLSRHDKWLCMMYPRLKLLREFMREDAAIFVSIDDNEVANLRLIMDDLFGARNFIATIIWQKMDSPKNTAVHLSEDHDYILLYARDERAWRPHPVRRSEEMLKRYKNPDNDPRGNWILSDLAARNFYAAGRYPITTPKGKTIEGPPAGSYWRVNEERFRELEADARIWWGKSGNNRPGIKRFLSEVKEGVVPQTLWFWKDVGSTRHSKQELSKLLDAKASSDLFITPKPSTLVKRILQIASDRDSLVLDSFAGSGTTMQSVMQLNREDNGNRQCILVEIEENIATEVTAERVRRVTQQEHARKDEGFRYCTLAEPLFGADGQISDDVKFAALAAHIFFTETGSPLPKRAMKNNPFIGQFDGVAYYLLFNGVMGDKRPNGGNVLTNKVLTSLPKHDGPKVIYGEACRLGAARLKQLGIVFKQLPYEVKTT